MYKIVELDDILNS